MINAVAIAITGFCGVAVVAVSLKAPYDNLKRLAGLCDKAQADLYAQFTRRHEIAADLVELVRATSAHVTEHFEDVSRAHAAITVGNADGEELLLAEERFGQKLGRLVDALMNDQDTKADARFQKLVRELAQVEALMASIQSFHEKAATAHSTQRNSLVGRFVSLFNTGAKKRRVKLSLGPVAAEEPAAINS